MITRPLDLESRLSPPPRNFDLAFWLSGILIALFFGLLGSRFVLAPGLLVGAGDGSFQLPQVSEATQNASAASVMVTFRRDNNLLFEDGVYALADLRKPFEAYARRHPGAVLLVRVDRQVSVQALLNLIDMAKAAGFRNFVLPTDDKTVLEPGQSR
ncbi:MAG: biopolymer transporter ExbD [Opitutaceae bacterium]|nr:biopolymer transporter ExbD [Opitutaceae bacterium]